MRKTVRCAGGFIGDGKPRIYIANHTCTRDAVAVLAALNKAGACMLVSRRRYADEPRLRNIGKSRIITASGGISTRWLHDALKRLNSGESLLIFPDGESPPQDKEFNSSFVLLSLLSGAEIVPLYSAPRRTVFRCLDITAGKPIRPDSSAALTAEVLKKEGERVKNALSALARV